MTYRDVLLELSRKYNGNRNDIFKHIEKKEPPGKNAEEVEERGKDFKEKFITLMDDEYPNLIKKSCSTPPFVLYYRGNINLLNSRKKKLAVIGSRKSSQYGEYATEKIISKLPDDVIIVSGAAKGIDTVGIKAALCTNKKVIAVIGSAIDSYYPKENIDLFNEILKAGGLIISEYPPGTPINPDNFRFRNRIIAGISNAVFVGEAYLKSGTKITISYALDYNKSIGCLPYQCYQKSYCNHLIKEGAALIENENDILDLLNY